MDLAPPDAVCIHPGCSSPATHETPLGVNALGTPGTEWVCHIHTAGGA